jgi:hypothetical protein
MSTNIIIASAGSTRYLKRIAKGGKTLFLCHQQDSKTYSNHKQTKKVLFSFYRLSKNVYFSCDYPLTI